LRNNRSTQAWNEKRASERVEKGNFRGGGFTVALFCALEGQCPEYSRGLQYCSISFNLYGHRSQAQKSTKYFVGHRVTGSQGLNTKGSHQFNTKKLLRAALWGSLIWKISQAQARIRKDHFVFDVTRQSVVRIITTEVRGSSGSSYSVCL
jgi:hypothetical protein